MNGDGVGDERLRLVFTCCHPALHLDAQVALTLRLLGGLTTPPEIALLYGLLNALSPSPVVELNRAIAVAMVEGPAAAGLAILDHPDVAGKLGEYRWLHSSRADLLRRLGRLDQSSAAYARALALSDNRAERAFLTGRLREIRATTAPS
ncbi:MAG TPA: hypothetical protein VGL23_05160 [Chloroflexota bacterium]